MHKRTKEGKRRDGRNEGRKMKKPKEGTNRETKGMKDGRSKELRKESKEPREVTEGEGRNAMKGGRNYRNG
jgi:hypothetical protein